MGTVSLGNEDPSARWVFSMHSYEIPGFRDPESMSYTLRTMPEKLSADFQGKRANDPRIVFVFDQAPIEICLVRGIATLLSMDEHMEFLRENNKTPQFYRPDILHWCMMAVHDSPLCRSGMAEVFIRTTKNELVRVHPSLVIPRTQSKFYAMLAYLFADANNHVKGDGTFLMRKVKNPVSSHLPPRSVTVGIHLNRDDIIPYTTKEVEQWRRESLEQRSKVAVETGKAPSETLPESPPPRTAGTCLKKQAFSSFLDTYSIATEPVVVFISVGADRAMPPDDTCWITHNIVITEPDAAALTAVGEVIAAAERMYGTA